MANWDVFHADRLELERELEPAAIRRAFERGEIRDDDLVRPTGTTVAWSRLADMPELMKGGSGAVESAERARASPSRSVERVKPQPPALSDYEVESDDFGPEPADSPATLRAPDFVELGADSDVAFPIINDEAQRRRRSASYRRTAPRRSPPEDGSGPNPPMTTTKTSPQRTTTPKRPMNPLAGVYRFWMTTPSMRCPRRGSTRTPIP